MSTKLATSPQDQAGVLEQVVVGGDLSKLSPRDRLTYYNAICASVGLNPLTRPLEYLSLSGKLVLYARKDCTDQLRQTRKVSIIKTEREVVEGVYVVTAYASCGDRVDQEIGAVAIDGLKGEARANAMMKAATKAKRRVTLSICGLGMLDETEAESIPDARRVRVDMATGEILDAPKNGSPRAEPEAEAGTPDEASERDVLLGRVSAQADKLKLNARQRADLWSTHCPGADPKTVSVEHLNDLYSELLKMALAARPA